METHIITKQPIATLKVKNITDLPLVEEYNNSIIKVPPIETLCNWGCICKIRKENEFYIMDIFASKEYENQLKKAL